MAVNFTMIPNEVIMSEDLSGDEKLVLMAIAMFGKSSFPSYETIGRYARCSRATVWKCLRSLEKKGIIQVNRSNRRKNVYSTIVGDLLEGTTTKLNWFNSVPHVVHGVNSRVVHQANYVSEVVNGANYLVHGVNSKPSPRVHQVNSIKTDPTKTNYKENKKNENLVSVGLLGASTDQEEGDPPIDQTAVIEQIFESIGGRSKTRPRPGEGDDERIPF